MAHFVIGVLIMLVLTLAVLFVRSVHQGDFHRGED
jgi:hypothetical protein